MSWENVSELAISYAEPAAVIAKIAKEEARYLPNVWHYLAWNPDRRRLHLGFDKHAAASDRKQWYRIFDVIGLDGTIDERHHAPRNFTTEPWVIVKTAADPTIAAIAGALNFKPTAFNQLFGGPSPLAAAIASGLVGAGLGYGAGALGENLLPESDFRRGRLRKTLATIGALTAASPAALWGATSYAHHPETPGPQALISGWPFRPEDSKDSPIEIDVDPDDGEQHAKSDKLNEILEKATKKLASDCAKLRVKDRLYKSAQLNNVFDGGTGLAELANMPMIHRDQFGRAVWQDSNTPIPIRAATTGLVNAASYMNDNSPFVSPWDVARVTAGGAARGMLVGKTLGVLAGLKPESQDRLQRAGVWGGMLQSVIPGAMPVVPIF